MSALLKPAELAYRGINRLRRLLYRKRILRAQRLPRVVISVGNITIGGAGKTPTVIAIANELSARGYRVAVLTRGYGRANGAPDGVVTALDAERFGDEPVLIAASIKGSVIVGSQRYENAIQYLAQNDCDLFILDDGFQHLQLARDVDVVLETSGTSWQREGRSALRDATFVLRRDGQPNTPNEFTAQLSPVAIRERGVIEPLDTLRGSRVAAFSGLANNDQFFETLRALGASVVATHEFPDHHRYSATDIAAVLATARSVRASRVVTTEKDAVKLTGDAMMAVAVLVTEMRIEPAQPFFDALVARIEESRQRLHPTE